MNQINGEGFLGMGGVVAKGWRWIFGNVAGGNMHSFRRASSHVPHPPPDYFYTVIGFYF